MQQTISTQRHMQLSKDIGTKLQIPLLQLNVTVFDAGSQSFFGSAKR
jgi:hypothetical protein